MWGMASRACRRLRGFVSFAPCGAGPLRPMDFGTGRCGSRTIPACGAKRWRACLQRRGGGLADGRAAPRGLSPGVQ